MQNQKQSTVLWVQLFKKSYIKCKGENYVMKKVKTEKKDKIRYGVPWYKVDNKWFTTYLDETNDKTFTIMLLLNAHANRYGYVTISINYLMNIFNIKSSSKQSVKSIKHSLQFLLETGQISLYDNFINLNPIEVNFNSININDTMLVRITPLEENFTIVYYNEVKAILGYSGLDFRYRRSLLVFFTALVSYINNTHNCSYPSHKGLSKKAHIRSEATCIKYLDIIVNDLKLMVGKSSELAFLKNGTVQEISTVYARPEHIGYLDVVLKQREQEEIKKHKSVRSSNNDNANICRSLKQKINVLNKERLYRKLTPEEEVQLQELINEHSRLSYSIDQHLEEMAQMNPYLPEEEIEVEEDEIPDILEFPIDHIKMDIDANRGTAIIERIKEDSYGW